MTNKDIFCKSLTVSITRWVRAFLLKREAARIIGDSHISHTNHMNNVVVFSLKLPPSALIILRVF